jgi:Fur family transcriptional regulator, ferric uptake regulator
MSDRLTKSQQRVLDHLKQAKSPVAAQELYLALRGEGNGVGLATVYRSLDLLKREGLVQARLLPSGESVYSMMQHDRHHLTCVQCGKILPIDACPVHHLEEKLSVSHQFKIHYHVLEFFGLCSDCQATASV